MTMNEFIFFYFLHEQYYRIHSKINVEEVIIIIFFVYKHQLKTNVL